MLDEKHSIEPLLLSGNKGIILNERADCRSVCIINEINQCDNTTNMQIEATNINEPSTSYQTTYDKSISDSSSNKEVR